MNLSILTLNEKKFFFRTVLLLCTLLITTYDIKLLEHFLLVDIGMFSVYHVIWFLLMLEMVLVFVPRFNSYVGCGKIYARNYLKAVYREEALREYTEMMNRRALFALLLWLMLLSGIGLLFLKNIISRIFLLVLVVFFYFADQFCINVWCPFRSWIVRNKCCNACRIYNWGHFMIFSPLLFIPDFWTYSLVFTSILIFLQWEYQHYRFPERFSPISNLSLRCSNCTTKCKKRLKNLDTK